MRHPSSGIDLLWLCLVLGSLFHLIDGSSRSNLRLRETADKQQSLRNLQLSTSTTFKLMNADSDTVITTLMQNSIVDIGSTPPNQLTIEISTTGFLPRSVKLSLTGAQTYSKVEGGKFALCGNSGSNYYPCKFLSVGKYKLNADFYTKSFGNGDYISSSSIDFELTNTMVAPVKIPSPTPFPMRAPFPIFTPVTVPTPVNVPVQVESCSVPKVSSFILNCIHGIF
jgi:hypothetical protein